MMRVFSPAPEGPGNKGEVTEDGQCRFELLEIKLERKLAEQRRHADEQVRQLERMQRAQLEVQQNQHAQLLATILQQQAMMLDLIKSVTAHAITFSFVFAFSYLDVQSQRGLLHISPASDVGTQRKWVQIPSTTSHSGFCTRSASVSGSRKLLTSTLLEISISLGVRYLIKMGLPRHLTVTVAPSLMLLKSNSAVASAKTSADALM
ncbi:hypothetical protein PsorP6_008655 [Peronosclerospora sorghi]|uniref:Uncharacterized protein n=1 Tax=Peronosclerospora sorghi TaxID=230839 RepID=A0ACC0WDL3_9STRA|nr:hypothetical protein PsorP6_008655 [Peronosclerospora sorghi]